MGGGVGLFLASGVLLLSALCAERAVKKVCKATDRASPGMARTIELVMRQHPAAVPRVLIYPDPFPNALVVRSLGSTGTLFLSQGLIALLTDQELQAILGMCIEALGRPGILLQSFSSTLALWVLSGWPEAWRNLVFPGRLKWKEQKRILSPLSTLPILVLFPVALVFYRLGHLQLPEPQSSRLDENRSIAVRKINQTLRIWGLSERREPLSLFSLGLWF